MMERNSDDQKELSRMITEAVDKGIRKAGRRSRIFSTILILLILCGTAFCAYRIYESTKMNTSVMEPVENHDLTLENHKLLGYTAADFEPAILGESTRQKELIVDEQEVSVPTSFTKTGAFNWAIFSQTQNETVFGTGTYTIDLSEVTSDSIDFDEDNLTITITVPYPELHSVTFDPSKTVIGDAQKGWLAFGDIKLTAEQRKEFQEESVSRLTDRLNETDCFNRAVKYAQLSAREIYQPIVSTISPAYKVEIRVADPLPLASASPAE